jgi:hypothetical protein
MSVRRLMMVFCIVLTAACSQPTTGGPASTALPDETSGSPSTQEPTTPGDGSSSTTGAAGRTTTTEGDGGPVAEPPPPLRWVRSEAPNLTAGTPGGWYADVATLPNGGWVAAGTTFGRSLKPHPTVWSASNGSSWRRAELKSPNGGRLLAVASTGNVLVAAGQTGSGADGAGLLYVRRGDGALRRVKAAVLRVPGGLRLSEVAAGSGGFIVLGTTTDPTSDPWVVLSSRDGRDWVNDRGLERALASAPAAEVSSASVGDGGILVAGTVQAGGRRRGTIWRKPNGGRWRTETFAGNGHVVSGVATDSGEALVVGGTLGPNGYRPAVWRLAGGRWVVQSPSISTSGRTLYNSYGESFESLSGGGGEWWATAYIDAVYVLLRSNDGKSWNEVILPFGLSDPAGPAVDLIASAGARALVASSDATRPALVTAEGQTTAEVISEALPTRSPTRYAATADVAQDQLIIVGGQEDADPAPVSLGGLVWVSDDGRRTRLTGDAQFADAVLSAATAQKGRQVVVGYDVFTTLFIATGQVNPITWSRSGTGGPWSAPQRSEGTASANTTRMLGVVGGSMAVAVGHEGTGADSFNPRFWFASEPGAWQPANGPSYQQWVSAEVVCPLGNGWVAFGVAVGGDETQAIAWTSKDGRVWVESAPPGTLHPSGSAVFDCASRDRSVVVVGQVRGRQTNPAVWITSDGRRFRRVEDPDLVLGGNGTIYGVDADREGRLYAVATAEVDGVIRPVLFRSGPAGQSWRATVLPDDVFLAPEGQQSVSDIAIFNRRIVIVGQYLGQAGVWSAALPG